MKLLLFILLLFNIINYIYTYSSFSTIKKFKFNPLILSNARKPINDISNSTNGRVAFSYQACRDSLYVVDSRQLLYEIKNYTKTFEKIINYGRYHAENLNEYSNFFNETNLNIVPMITDKDLINGCDDENFCDMYMHVYCDLNNKYDNDIILIKTNQISNMRIYYYTGTDNNGHRNYKYQGVYFTSANRGNLDDILGSQNVILPGTFTDITSTKGHQMFTGGLNGRISYSHANTNLETMNVPSNYAGIKKDRFNSLKSEGNIYIYIYIYKII